jgi:D-tyrosyl-tRNA(Tyr) deacylase
VTRAEVTIAGESVGRIERGLVVLLGVVAGDTPDDVDYMVDKIAGLRIFEDEAGKMNRDVTEIGGGMLIVSQFTLAGDCRRGKRPSFTDAASPELAVELYQSFVTKVAARGVPTATGRFRENMQVALVNDGPVTLLVDSRKLF